MNDKNMSGIAIVGMSGRFPGAKNVDQFWENIKAGRNTVSHFSRDELEIQPGDEDGKFVCAKGVLDDVDMFDARFFGYLPREAEVMDPQHRIFLEICWEAMEHAGYDASRYDGSVGVYAGCYMDTYLLSNLCSDDEFRARLIDSIQVGTLQTELGNDKDYLATRVAFKLGLRGPAMTLQTACSTSLVAIATACQALETYGCDMALAGGVTIVLPQKRGYFYKEGGMLSPDGVCRTFSSDAAGTVFSNGAAVLLMKRVEDAIADGDTIYAVIKGYATNNDGGTKVSYTAPSVEGQSEVISLAMGMGGIDARSIGYVEAHGTATPLGDPIEIAGLSTAYRRDTEDTQFCAIGSVKANLGHLDCASGAIGLIKTSLALHDRVLPPQINYAGPNPNIDFGTSPFYVNTELKPWDEGAYPRRAAVSSFGVGGTNAHVVAEEPPRVTDTALGEARHLFVLSARGEEALKAQKAQLADALAAGDIPLADAAHTTQVGRREFEHRTFASGRTVQEVVTALRGDTSVLSPSTDAPSIGFLFPGQGAQYPGMGRGLYETDATYRDTIDAIAEALKADDVLGLDIRSLLLWTADSDLDRETASEQLAQTRIAQPAIFAVEVALARALMAKGIHPDIMVGHSIGEFAAATLAGVFDMADAARLVVKRGDLMQAMAPGQMLAVRLPQVEAQRYISGDIALAAVNSPGLCVLSGPTNSVQALSERLEAEGVQHSILKTSHAFHSPMMAPARAELEQAIAAVQRHDASIEIVSTTTGEMLTPEALKSPTYWGQQLLSPVLFEPAIREAAKPTNRILIEVGPGQTLMTLTKQSLADDSRRPVTACLGPVQQPGDDEAAFYTALGTLWGYGARPNWAAFHDGPRRRVPLPTYPFQRKRYWIEPKKAKALASDQQTVPQPQAANGNALETLIKGQLDIIAGQLAALKK